jgi:type III pantothenate kinase
MILAVDIGNTKTAAGLMAGAEVRARANVRTDTSAAPEVLWAALAAGLGGKVRVDGAIVCSVVPKATARVVEAVRTGAGVEPVEFTATTPVGITNRYEPPGDVGADRLVNAYAAWKLHGLPAIIVDIGTALTIDCISREAEYLGGVIAPGIGISLDALHERTALLPRVELKPPARLLGTSTATSIQSGVTHGHAVMIASLVEGLRQELPGGREAHVVITGGYTAILRPQLEAVSTLIEPELTLKGLALIYEALARAQ